MKIIAWNINGMRNMLKNSKPESHPDNNLKNLLEKEDPDIICFGETKLSCPSIDLECISMKDDKLKIALDQYKYKYIKLLFYIFLKPIYFKVYNQILIFII